jgi:hypothetical protein
VIESAPSAACQTVGSLEAGNPGLDPGAEVAQLAINPATLDHVFDRQAVPLVGGYAAAARRNGRIQIARTIIRLVFEACAAAHRGLSERADQKAAPAQRRACFPREGRAPRCPGCCPQLCGGIRESGSFP